MEKLSQLDGIDVSGLVANSITSLAYVAFGVCLFFASSCLRFSVGLVPFTMESQVILFISLSYPGGLASATISTIYALVLCGVPLLSTPATGLSVLFSPSLGYLMGFFLVSVFLSQCESSRQGRGLFVWLRQAALGQGIILSCGFLWLACIVGIERAFFEGVLPFLLTDSLKVWASAFLAREVSSLNGK